MILHGLADLDTDGQRFHQDPAEYSSNTRHTVSAPLLLRIRQYSQEPSNLRDAAMIIALRQEIHIANLTKRSVELTGQDCGIEDSLEPASDVIWVCRMMSHTAKVTNYAYGDGPRTEARWDQLWQYLEEWDQRKPPSFDSLNRSGGVNDGSNSFERPAAAGVTDSDTPFPEVYYAYDCPIAGQQYSEICRIILLAHDPRTPGLGPGRTDCKRLQEERIRKAVRSVCGIWVSNPEYAPARALAGLAIGMAGELFTNTPEMMRLLDIIGEAESHIGWPCLKVSTRLRLFWAAEGSGALSLSTSSQAFWPTVIQ